MLDIETGVAEARTLHPSTGGFFATLRKIPDRKSIHRMYTLDRLDQYVRALDKVPNAYVSQSSFVTTSRKVSAFKSINCAFVDIDCYKPGEGRPGVVPDQAFIDRLHARAREAGLPEPSYTTFSGRGVYCKWIFDKPISAHQRLRWEALQAVLVPLYASFGADAAVKDVSRVLRIVGSSHSEVDGYVRIGSNTNVRHDFDTLCRAAQAVDTTLLGITKEAKTLDAAKKAEREVARIKKSDLALGDLNPNEVGNLEILRNYEANNQPSLLQQCSTQSLNWSRFVDLRTLAEMRGGIMPGSRDMMLFWMATSLSHAGVLTSDTLEEEMGDLVKAFSGPGFDPIGDGSLLSVVKRLRQSEAGLKVQFNDGWYNPLYTSTNDHLIDVLGITPDEQQKLVTVIGTDEKRRRVDEKNPGRSERRAERIEVRERALEMAAACVARGETPNKAQIARSLGTHRTHISRLLNGKLDRDPNLPETRGRKKMKCPPGTVRMIPRSVGTKGYGRMIWVPDPNHRPVLAGETLDPSAQILADAAIAKAMGKDGPVPQATIASTAAASTTPTPGSSQSRAVLTVQRPPRRQNPPDWCARHPDQVFHLSLPALPPKLTLERAVFSFTRKDETGRGALAREREKGWCLQGTPRAVEIRSPSGTLEDTAAPPQPGHPVPAQALDRAAAQVGQLVEGQGHTPHDDDLSGMSGWARFVGVGKPMLTSEQVAAYRGAQATRSPEAGLSSFWPREMRRTHKASAPKASSTPGPASVSKPTWPALPEGANAAEPVAPNFLAEKFKHYPRSFFNEEGKFVYPTHMTDEDHKFLNAESVRLSELAARDKKEKEERKAAWRAREIEGERRRTEDFSRRVREQLGKYMKPIEPTSTSAIESA